MAISRKTKWILGIAIGCLASLAALPYAIYEYVTRERWRLQYLRWEPIPWAPEHINQIRREVNAIGAKRRWTGEDIDRLETILAIDLDSYSDEYTEERASDRVAMGFVMGDVLYIISDRLLRGPLDDEAMRRRLEETLLGALDHEQPRIRSGAVAWLVDARLARRPEVHARLLVMQHSDPSSDVRNIARIQLKGDAVLQDLERKGKIYVPPEWLRRR